MAKQYSKSAQSKSYGGGSGLEGSIAQGANLETLKYQNQSALRNAHDDDADLFADIGDSVSAPGQRPRGLGANLAAGVSKGLAYGSKTKSTEERKGNFDKYANVMNYLQEVNTAAIEQKQWHEQRESARKEMMPQVLAYIDNIDRLDPQSQRFMAQDMLSQYGEAIGENFKLSSVDGSNPFLMTIQSDKGQQMFDLRSLFAGDEVMQQSIAMKMPEYQMKLQQERKDKERDFELREKAFEARYPTKSPVSEGADSNPAFEYNGNKYDTVPLSGLQKGEITDYGKTVNKAVSQIGTNENSIKAVNTMREVFQRNPNIGESYVNMLSDGDSEDTWGRYIAKKFVGRQERADMEILKKASSDLNLSTVLSIPGKSATDILKRAIQASSPTGTLTKEAFDKVSNDWEERAMNNIDTAKAMAHARSKNQMIVSKSSGQAGHSNNQNEISQGSSGTNSSPKGLVIRDPATGETVEIAENQLDSAIAGGWEQVTNG